MRRAYKRKKLNFGRSKTANQIANELREGVTYKYNVDSREITSSAFHVIPPAACLPSYKLSNVDPLFPVFFYLETTSLAKDCEII